jgi:hypothetical protein
VTSTLLALTGVLVGLPIGLIVGRRLWRIIARRLGIVDEPAIGSLVFGVAPLAALLVALAVAAVVGWRISRASIADQLRVE